ncbi:hypothetical protein HYH03_012365 [Edaphochlamys debaryana]|uniref:Uncharacterized protein n=1 Tax=Edaphochlamys debaryana TaxID=47281 RepID=A0A835Y0Y4_9CHLO|nr:hypothetical protein HYH03_012365 [Edaphochlamys debaryana]|eukprot:KAG2489139.1 hypothetical protein HYH03_012365 [Edaphochlamys debaryana]
MSTPSAAPSSPQLCSDFYDAACTPEAEICASEMPATPAREAQRKPIMRAGSAARVLFGTPTRSEITSFLDATELQLRLRGC